MIDTLVTHTCRRCNASYVDLYVCVQEHTGSDWNTIKEATYDDEGTEQLICSCCGGVIETRTLPKLEKR